MEVSFSLAIVGPLTFHGEVRKRHDWIEIAKELGEVRKKHWRLSVRGGVSKLVLDELMRKRLALQLLNYELRERMALDLLDAR